MAHQFLKNGRKLKAMRAFRTRRVPPVAMTPSSRDQAICEQTAWNYLISPTIPFSETACRKSEALLSIED
jgi:hypothetical protein